MASKRKKEDNRRKILVGVIVVLLLVSALLVLLGSDDVVLDEVGDVVVSASSRTPRVMEEVVFTAERGGGGSFIDMMVKWNFGVGREQQGTLVYHSFQTEGSHLVTLTVTSSSGGSLFKTISLFVQSPLSPNTINPIFTSPAPSTTFSSRVVVEGPVKVCITDGNEMDINNVDLYVSNDGLTWQDGGAAVVRGEVSGKYDGDSVGRWSMQGTSEWEFELDISEMPPGDLFLMARVFDVHGRYASCALLTYHQPIPPRPVFSSHRNMAEVNGTFDLEVSTDSDTAVSAFFYEVAFDAGDGRRSTRSSLLENAFFVDGRIVGPNVGEELNNFCAPASSASGIMSFAEQNPDIMSVPGRKVSHYIRYFEEHRKTMGLDNGDYYEILSDGTMRLKSLGLSIVLSKKMGTTITQGTTTGQVENGLRAFFVEQSSGSNYVVEGLTPMETAQGIEYGPMSGNSDWFAHSLRRDDIVLMLLNSVSPGSDMIWGTRDDHVLRDTGMWVLGVEHSWEMRSLTSDTKEFYGLYYPSEDSAMSGINIRGEAFDAQYYIGGGAVALYRHIVYGDNVYRVEHALRISSMPEVRSDNMHKIDGLNYIGNAREGFPRENGGRTFNHMINSMTGGDGFANYVCIIVDEDGTAGWEEVMLYVNNNPPSPTVQTRGNVMEDVTVQFTDWQNSDLMGGILRWHNGTSWLSLGWSNTGFLTFNSMHLPDGVVAVNLTVLDFSGRKGYIQFTIEMPSVSFDLDGPVGFANNTYYINSSTSFILDVLNPPVDDALPGITYYRIGRTGPQGNETWGPFTVYNSPFSIMEENGDVSVEYYRIWENGYSTRRHRFAFVSDNTPPIFTITEPLEYTGGGGSNQTPNLLDQQPVEITFSLEDRILSVAYYYKMPETGQESLLHIEMPDDPRMDSLEIVWDTKYLEPGRYGLRIIALDIVGQAHEEFIYVYKNP